MNERYDSNMNIELKSNTKEEVLPDFSHEFPYTVTKAYIESKSGTWHWHKAVELFYIESGSLEYHTPGGRVVLEAGCGGMVNSGVLHMTNVGPTGRRCVQLLHLFDTTLVTGYTGSRIDQKYIVPITGIANLELIQLSPERPEQAAILDKIKASFLLGEDDFGYEIRLRSILSDIWMDILSLSTLPKKQSNQLLNEKIKTMMVYIHEHYADKITISDIAAAGFVSERECYRTFQAMLHMTPNEYIREYRLQAACRLLRDSTETITNISQSCGFGSSSFFGKVFREVMEMTPVEYRIHNQKRMSIPS